jgi:hypothetical protein
MRRNQTQQQNKNPMKEKLKTNVDTSDLLIEGRLAAPDFFPAETECQLTI